MYTALLSAMDDRAVFFFGMLDSDAASGCMIALREGMRMYSVKEAAQRTGVSIRTLHHYDRIGLLKPAKVGDNGYRAYDDASLERLRCILLYRELDFSLSDIRQSVSSESKVESASSQSKVESVSSESKVESVSSESKAESVSSESKAETSQSAE